MVTKYPKSSSLNNRDVFFTVLEAGKSKIKVAAYSVLYYSSFLGFWTALPFCCVLLSLREWAFSLLLLRTWMGSSCNLIWVWEPHGMVDGAPTQQSWRVGSWAQTSSPSQQMWASRPDLLRNVLACVPQADFALQSRFSSYSWRCFCLFSGTQPNGSIQMCLRC